MEPLTTATSFATILSLISNFLAERRHADSIDIEEFLLWVSDHGFNEIRNQIESNLQTTISIKSMLHDRSDVISERLSKLDNVLASIASEVQGVKELAISIMPNVSISRQAVNILRQLDQKQSRGFYEVKIVDNDRDTVLHLYEGGDLDYDDPRFIEDDINTLVKLGFLRLTHTADGMNKYGITRAASEYIKLM